MQHGKNLYDGAIQAFRHAKAWSDEPIVSMHRTLRAYPLTRRHEAPEEHLGYEIVAELKKLTYLFVFET